MNHLLVGVWGVDEMQCDKHPPTWMAPSPSSSPFVGVCFVLAILGKLIKLKEQPRTAK